MPPSVELLGPTTPLVFKPGCKTPPISNLHPRHPPILKPGPMTPSISNQDPRHPQLENWTLKSPISNQIDTSDIHMPIHFRPGWINSNRLENKINLHRLD